MQFAISSFCVLDACGIGNGLPPLALPQIKGSRWPTSTVHRAGFTEGFSGPHILIPQGVERATGRVRAAYTEQSRSQPAQFTNGGRVWCWSAAAWQKEGNARNLVVERSSQHRLHLALKPHVADHDRAFACTGRLRRDLQKWSQPAD